MAVSAAETVLPKTVNQSASTRVNMEDYDSLSIRPPSALWVGSREHARLSPVRRLNNSNE